jgi:PPOX class probable F420-dependent enzyme
MMTLPEGLLALLSRPSPCFIATVDPDGSPQLTETWVDTDGEHIVINTVEGFRKVRNVERDPRVSVIVTDPDNITDYYSVKATSSM